MSDDDFVVNVNWDEVTDDDYSPIPKGEYVAKLTAMEPKTSNSGNRYFNAKWQISGPDYAGRIVFDSFSVVKKAMFMLKRASKALGVEVDGEQAFDVRTMLNRSCVISVDTDSYADAEGNEKTKNIVTTYAYGDEASGSSEQETVASSGGVLKPGDDCPF